MSPEMKLVDVEPNPTTSKVVYLPGGEYIPTPRSIFIYYCLNLAQKVPHPQNADFHFSNASAPLEMDSNNNFIVLGPAKNEQMRDYLHRLVKDIQQNHLSTLGEYAQAKINRLNTFADYLIHASSKKGKPMENLRNMGLSTDTYELLQDTTINNWPHINYTMYTGIKTIHTLINKKEGDPKTYQSPKDSLSDTTKSHPEHLNYLIKYHERELEEMKALSVRGQQVSMPVVLAEETLDIQRSLGRLDLLKGQKIGFGVVGPPNSGKSTIVANLVKRMQADLWYYQAHGYGQGVNCAAIDFDGSTPDVESILKEGSFAGFAPEQKTEWTQKLADNLIQNYLNQKEGVFVVNMPGKVSSIIDSLLLPIDSTMLIIGANTDEEWLYKRNEWGKTLKKDGLKPTFLLRSRLYGEKSRSGLDAISAATNLVWLELAGFNKNDWIERVGGRAVGLNRKLKDYDEMIVAASKILLLDILPRLVIERKIKTLEQLKLLRVS